MTEQNTTLSKESILQITELFSDIDSKVAELHVISTKDFSVFQDLFKNYHKKTKDVVGTARDLLKFYCNLSEYEFVNESLTLAKLIKDKIKNIRHTALQTSEKIKTTQDEIARLFIPFNNFRQNLLTVKFLLANVKLSQYISDQSDALEMGQLVDSIIVNIQTTRNQLPEMDKNIQLLGEQTSIIYGYIQILLNNILPEIEEYTSEMELSIEKIHQNRNAAVDDSLKVEDSNQRCLKNFDSVITNLQYHDIIRQKMEHIQSTHHTIISDLNAVDANEQMIDDSIQYIKQIPDVIGVQAVQLVHTNKEYQKAIETISQKILDIGSDVSSVYNFCAFKADHSYTFESTISYFSEMLVKIQDQFLLLAELSIKLQKGCAMYQDKIGTELDKKQKLHEDIKNRLVQLATKIQEVKLSDKRQKDIITKQIEPLLQDINIARTQMENLVPDQQHSTIRAYIMNLIEQIAITARPLNIAVENCHDNIFAKGSELKTIVAKIQTLDISDINHSIENIAYYNVFDSEVEKIIDSINKINGILIPVIGQVSDTDYNLMEHIESMYTMRSEHNIHHGIAADTNNDDDSDLELF